MGEQVDRWENMCWINNRHERSVDLRRIKGKLETALSLYLAGLRWEEKRRQRGITPRHCLFILSPESLLLFDMNAVRK